jgi:taurine dioxygenase
MLVKPMTGTFGAEIQDLDITRPLDDGKVTALRDALNEHRVLIFRDQPITPQEQRDFALNFGPIADGFMKVGNDEPVPGITVIESGNAKNLNDEWHTDQTIVDVPPLAAMLHAAILPSVGGDTIYADTVAAYEALSTPMRAFLDGLTATHSSEHIERRVAQQKKNFTFDSLRSSHPVVRLIPETGRKSLFVNPKYTARIEGMTEAESNAVLGFLYRHMASAEFQLRIRWSPHMSVLWDERTTVHYAIPDYTEPRVMHRLMIEGSKPVGVAA